MHIPIPIPTTLLQYSRPEQTPNQRWRIRQQRWSRQHQWTPWPSQTWHRIDRRFGHRRGAQISSRLWLFVRQFRNHRRQRQQRRQCQRQRKRQRRKWSVHPELKRVVRRDWLRHCADKRQSAPREERLRANLALGGCRIGPRLCGCVGRRASDQVFVQWWRCFPVLTITAVTVESQAQWLQRAVCGRRRCK